MENRLRLLTMAFLLVAVLLAGCAGSPPATTTVNNVTAPPPAPAPLPVPSAIAPPPSTPAPPAVPPASTLNPVVVNPTTSGLSWTGKKALSITQLKLGDALPFDGGQLKLTNLSRQGTPTATLEVDDKTGQSEGTLNLAVDQAMRFHASDGIDYLAVAVFDLSQGVSNSVQIQLYRVKDLSIAPPPIKVGEPQNAYTIVGEFPEPVLLANRSLAVGASISGPAFNTVLTGLNLGVSPVRASYGLQDGAGQALATFDLTTGQMMSFNAPDGNRYAVIFRKVDGNSAITELFQLQAYAR